MATSLRSKSFQTNLFFSVGGIFLLFALCFSIYQYQREKEFKIDILHSKLQFYNFEIKQSLSDSIAISQVLQMHVSSYNIDGLRVTLLSSGGEVLHDSYDVDITQFANHLTRPEIQQALQEGNGYDKRRQSESTNETYFYSATYFKELTLNGRYPQGIIIRSALPYSVELTESMKADNTYLAFALVLTFALGLVLYFNTRRISRHIGYLREFAVKAEQGQALDHELERCLPDDELGEISHTIITLYWKLRHSEEDKVRFKRQLTQNAAHELKTPNASIHGFLESILDNPNMPEDTRRHFLERCYAQSERMAKLLSDMEQLTRLDEASYNNTASNKNKVTQLDVIPVINNVLADTEQALQTAGIHVTTNLPERLFIMTNLNDPEESIYSVFRNLIDNALAHALGANHIHIMYHKQEFVFADNGVGVAVENLPYLFERFYRVDKGRSRKLGGTGLGLAIVKNIVLAQGGRVQACPSPGGGLTIRFTLHS